VPLRLTARHVPTRLATGAYVLHAGMEKWHANPDQAARMHAMAAAAFSATLTAMYLRTPSLHKPRSVWPTPAGIGLSKDVWMLGIGLSLLVDRVADNATTSKPGVGH
jgi:hypothetical protein